MNNSHERHQELKRKSISLVNKNFNRKRAPRLGNVWEPLPSSTMFQTILCPYRFRKSIQLLYSLKYCATREGFPNISQSRRPFSITILPWRISCKLIVYFSMKIQNLDHRGDPLYTFQIFSRVGQLNFFIKRINSATLGKMKTFQLNLFAFYQNKYRIWSL